MTLRHARILSLVVALFVAFGLSSVSAQGVADLSVTRITYPHNVQAGHPIRFRIVVTNNGPDTTEPLVLVSTSDSLQTFLLTCDRGISPDGAICEYNEVAAGESVTTLVTAVVAPDPGVTASLDVTLIDGYETLDPVPLDNTASVSVNIR